MPTKTNRGNKPVVEEGRSALLRRLLLLMRWFVRVRRRRRRRTYPKHTFNPYSTNEYLYPVHQTTKSGFDLRSERGKIACTLYTASFRRTRAMAMKEI